MLRLCYYRGVSSTTSSFRISDELRMRFEAVARDSGRGKNWILNRALEEYLDRLREDSLAADARRQSLLASAAPNPDAEFWSVQADHSGWA